MKDRFDIHQEITNRIVSAIEVGVGDFKLPWHRVASASAPTNVTTGRAYRGVNYSVLVGYDAGVGLRVTRMGDVQAMAGARRECTKSEKGSLIVFCENLAIDVREELGAGDEEGGKTIPFARASWVLTLQVDRYETDATPLPERPLFSASLMWTMRLSPQARGSVPKPDTSRKG